MGNKSSKTRRRLSNDHKEERDHGSISNMLTRLVPRRVAARMGSRSKRRRKIEQEGTSARHRLPKERRDSSKRQHRSNRMQRRQRTKSSRTSSSIDSRGSNKQDSENRTPLPNWRGVEKTAVTRSRGRSSKRSQRREDSNDKVPTRSHRKSESRRIKNASLCRPLAEESTRTAKVTTPGWHKTWRRSDGDPSHKSMRSIRKSNDAERSMTPSRRRKRDVIKALLFSRPMNQTTVKKVVAKIKHRDEMRMTAAQNEVVLSPASPSDRLRLSDEAFPSPRVRSERTPSFRCMEQRGDVDKHSSGNDQRSRMVDQLVQMSEQSYMRKKYSVCKNKDNNGRLLDTQGTPFWCAKSRQRDAEEDDEEENTDEELPMNADILLEVESGKRKLAEMPQRTLLMDPYERMEKLRSRDAIFFTKEVLFSNTVRTMVNINDAVDSSEQSTKLRIGHKVNMVEPNAIANYVCNAACEQFHYNVENFQRTLVEPTSDE